MKGIKIFYLVILFLVVTTSCTNHSVSSHEEYVAWLNDEKNGVIKSKESGGIMLEVKVLPSNYLAYQDIGKQINISKEVVDSLITSYDKSLTFLLTISVDGDLKKGDIMYQGLKDYTDYKERLYNLNFDIENNMFLRLGKKKYKPVLTNLENVYGLTDKRNITVVFIPETIDDDLFYSEEKIQFTYDDLIFKTGINHFTFKRDDIKNTPSFIFWN